MRYDDIIGLPHHRSKTHPPMAIGDRAAQFAPFAALTGYKDALGETARLTDARPELSEEQLSELNARLARFLEEPKPAVRKKTSCRRAGNDILNWIPGHPSAL